MGFLAAKLNSRSVPRIRELPVAAAEAEFKRGSPLVRDSDGAWAECGADPAAIGGFAESDYGADTTGFRRIPRGEFPPGYMQATLVTDEQVFRATYTGTLPAADGGSYGIAKDGTTGDWSVDFSDTTNTRVKLVGRLTESPIAQDEVLVVVLPAVVQIVA
jgi:hypothetical protein